MKINKVYKLYDQYNEKYFKGRLAYVNITFVDMNRAFGYTIQEGRGDCFMLLANGMKNSMVRTTLLHEMIHVDQVMKNHGMNHGRYFKQMAKKICRGEKLLYRTF